MDRRILDQVEQHLLRPLRNRISNIVARGVVKLVNDGAKMQLVQLGVLKDEVIDGAEHFQAYGFSSVPLAGAVAAVLFPSGDRSHAIALAATDRRYRPTGGRGGEVCMYTDEGDVIRLGRGHVVSVETTGQVLLGSDSASEGAIKGTQRNTAEQTFLTALGAFATAIGALNPVTASAAATTLNAAITAFKTAAAAAVSTKVKLE